MCRSKMRSLTGKSTTKAAFRTLREPSQPLCYGDSGLMIHAIVLTWYRLWYADTSAQWRSLKIACLASIIGQAVLKTSCIGTSQLASALIIRQVILSVASSLSCQITSSQGAIKRSGVPQIGKPIAETWFGRGKEQITTKRLSVGWKLLKSLLKARHRNPRLKFGCNGFVWHVP